MSLLKVTAALAAALALAACGASESEVRSVETSIDRPQAEAPATPRYITAPSRFGHDETLSRLLSGIDQRDLTLFAMIDHQAGGVQADVALPPMTLVIFGSPAIGSPLMLDEPQLAAELPLRAAVYEDAKGEVVVAVTSMRALAREFETFDQNDERLARVRKNLEALMAEAAGQEG